MKQEHAEKGENLHEFGSKTNRYIETNRKAETTIQQLNNLINEKSRENSIYKLNIVHTAKNSYTSTWSSS